MDLLNKVRRLYTLTTALTLLGLSVVSQAAFTIDTVTVGDPGNAADTKVMYDGTTGYGSVSYTYNIGKYEVTAGQYTAFLNAAAATDTYGLYNTDMAATDFGCGISRSGSSGSFSYTVNAAFVNRPVRNVSFWDACRFANWLNNGQGNADTEIGSYTLTSDGIAANKVTRNANWKWAVTSEDEWYKAAYYKGGGTNAGYWLYPTQSDTTPGQDMADASGNNANCAAPPYTHPIDDGKYTTIVGQFTNSASAYGTFDQGGNLWEWNEATINGVLHSLRGGSYNWGTYSLQSLCRNDYMTDFGYLIGYSNLNDGISGFRVVQVVPEPSSILALVCGMTGLVVRKRH